MSDWQGLLYKEVKEKYADDHHCWQNTPHLFTRDCGASRRHRLNYPVLELYKQAQSFWQSILSQHRGQTILIVAHGGTNRALISTAIALAPQHYHTLQQCNCGISCLEFPSRSNIGQLKFLNSTKHLGKSLPKLKAGKTGWRWLLLSNQMAEARSYNSYLSELFTQDLIDLILIEDSDTSREAGDRLMQRNSKALQISVNSNMFLHRWQRTISARQKNLAYSNACKLFTGLIIAPERLITQIMQQTVNAESALNLTDGLAVIHYPGGERRSILQGVLPLRSDLAIPDVSSRLREVEAIAS